jgi:hypothetical protein
MNGVVTSREQIWWRSKAPDGMITAPKWLEPTGFFPLHPQYAGSFWRMRIGGSSKIARTADG